MSTTVPLIFSLAPIPTGQSLDANQYGQMLIANLQASITANFLLGQTGGPEPSTDIGPWFNSSNWWAWNDSQSKYVPLASTTVYSSIIDAQMQVWQRNIIFPSISNTQFIYTSDRWFAASELISGTATVAQASVGFPGTEQYPRTALSLRVIVVTPQVTIGASEHFTIGQRIERIFALPLFDNPTSLSIVLQSSVAGTYCVSLSNSDNSWSYVMECNIDLPNTPQYFSFPGIPTMPTDTGDWGSNGTDRCYTVRVCASCGSGFQDLPNAWNAENQLATTNQTNLFDTAGNTLDITLVQHEPSPVCNAFKYVPFDEDLRRCHRYYAKSNPMASFPLQFVIATSATTGSGGTVLTFASTISPSVASVSNGMFVFGTNISNGTTVSGVTATTVSISPATTGAIAIGANISFSSGVSTGGEIVFIPTSSTSGWGILRFPVNMRTIPTVNLWSALYGQKSAVLSVSQGFNVGPVTDTATLSENGFGVIQTTSAWAVASNVLAFNYTADAEL